MKRNESVKVKVNPEQSREICRLLNEDYNAFRGYEYLRIEGGEICSASDYFLNFTVWGDKEITAPELIALLSQDKETKMPNLSDFLKCEKVRCVSNLYEHVRKDKPYKLIGIRVFITDESGDLATYPVGDFEPVLETAIQATDSSTPMGTRTVNEPKFEIGNPVYCPSMLDGEIYTVRKNTRTDNGDGLPLFVLNDHEDCYDFGNDGTNQFNNPIVYHATEENRQALQVLHPDIEFEKPPVLLQGSDLCRAMLDKGWKYVPCYVSNYSEDKRCAMDIVTARNFNGQFIANGGNFNHAVPFDPRTGKPLTSEVLEK